jgi:hypothetical protein
MFYRSSGRLTMPHFPFKMPPYEGDYGVSIGHLR